MLLWYASLKQDQKLAAGIYGQIKKIIINLTTMTATDFDG